MESIMMSVTAVVCGVALVVTLLWMLITGVTDWRLRRSMLRAIRACETCRQAEEDRRQAEVAACRADAYLGVNESVD